MPGDRLIVQADTPEKPEILAVAGILNLDPEVVFAKCFKLWRWASKVTADGNIQKSVTPALLDALVHSPGFTDALLQVGWLQVRHGSLVIPNFDRHLSQTAKQKALTAERVSRHRERHSDSALSENRYIGNGEALQGSENDPRIVSSASSGSSSLGKKEESKEDTTHKGGGPGEGFAEFWAAYPRRTNRQVAVKAWKKLKPPIELRATILAAVERQKASAQWQRGVVPHPGTWLNQKRWEDEAFEGGRGPPAASKAESVKERYERIKRESQCPSPATTSGPPTTPPCSG